MVDTQIDVEIVVSDIVSAISGVAGGKWDQISGFARKQSQLLATQAAMIAQSRTVGSLRNNDELYEFFVEGLERDTRNFARALVQLTLLTVQEIWNALVEVLWGHINRVLGEWNLGPLLVPPAPSA